MAPNGQGRGQATEPTFLFDHLVLKIGGSLQETGFLTTELEAEIQFNSKPVQLLRGLWASHCPSIQTLLCNRLSE